MLHTRFAVLGSALALAFAGPVLTATSADAAEVWHQSISRAGQNAACPTESDAGWSPWAPSWAQWANGGAGGWVCDRYIVWADDEDVPAPPRDETDDPEDPPVDPPVDPTCAEYIADSSWLSFASGNPIQLPANIVYTNANCTGTPGSLGPVGQVVYAATGAAALALCTGNDPTSQLLDPPAVDPNIWLCVPSA